MYSIKRASARGSRRRHTIGSAADASPTSKRVASNERRLEALKQRRKQLTAATPLTIDVDHKSTNSANKRIVFDSESSDEETERVTSGKQSLDLFDEGEDDISAHFATKKQFEGASGEKLFRLQQQIGADKRFRLDERFAVSSDEEGAESDSVKSDGGMEEEKEQSRRILASLLGTGSSVAKNKIHKPSSFSLIRHFDPSNASCADMEQDIKQASKDKPLLSESEDEEVEDTKSPPPPVSKESYYKVSSHLKNLLTDRDESDEKQHSFNFFADEEDNSDEAEDRVGSSPTEEEVIKTTPKWISKNSEPIEEDDFVSDGAMPAQEPSKKLLFFFHSSDPLLCNRLNEENTFYRTKSPDELIEKWTVRRAAVKLSYKRSRKLALKRTRKTNW